MNIIADRKTILGSIQVAQDVVASKTFISILSNIYLEVSKDSVAIRATDANIHFESKLPVDNLSDNEAVTVHCEKCYRALHSLTHEKVSLKTDGDNLAISPVEGEVAFFLRTLSPQEFPPFQYVNKDAFFFLSQRDFGDMIDTTIFAVSDDEARFFMNGVNIQQADHKLLFVATDGKRLSSAKASVSSGELPSLENVIIPPKVLRLVRKLLSQEGEVGIAVQDRSVYFSVGDMLVSSLLIEGPFPDYEKVIPDTQSHSLSVKSDLFRDGLRRVSLLAEKSKRIFCSFKPQSIFLHSEEADVGHVEESIPCVYEGPELKFAFNYQYLLDPLMRFQDEELHLHFSDPSKVITILGSGDTFHIVMPMRVE